MGRGGDLDQPWGTGGNIGGSGLYSTPAGWPADRLAGQAVHVVTMSNGPRARRVREATRFIGIKQ